MISELDVPDEVRGTLNDLGGVLDGWEGFPKGYSSGETIIKRVFGGRTGDWVNVIPDGEPGPFRPVLVVAIGSDDSWETAKKRLVKATTHVVKSGGRTRLVVFVAMWWGAETWHDYGRDMFRELGVPCVLMQPFIEPQRLR